MPSSENGLEVRNLIGGRWEERDGRDTEPVYDPATGEVVAQTPLSTRDDVDRAVKRARGSVRLLGRHPGRRAGEGPLLLQESPRGAFRGVEGPRHTRERQGCRRRRRGGQAWNRGRRVRVRDADPDDGRDGQGRGERYRQLFLALPSWGGCGHNPVQLPLHGAPVDDARGYRGRQRLHPQAFGEDAPVRGEDGRDSSPRRGCPMGSSPS